MSNITVKVIKMPGLIKDVVVPDTANAGAAIREAGISLNERVTVKVNGLDSDADAMLRDGDSIIVSEGAKGNN